MSERVIHEGELDFGAPEPSQSDESQSSSHASYACAGGLGADDGFSHG